MSVSAEIQSLSPTSIIELYVLDLSSMPGGTVARFHAGTNAMQQQVVWQGQSYQSIPIEAEGFDVMTKGTLPRPKIRIANVDGIISAEVAQYDDLIGCKVTRKRTFLRYLDAVNFPGGVNPTADPNQHLADDVWFIDRKVSENRYIVEWELASAFDVQGVMLPFRQIIQNSCPWRYRGPECGYTGPAYDSSDKPCATNLDYCAKRFSSCKARFGYGNLPFGGFPGAQRIG